MQIDMRVMELLASKLCHDLVSPVSAINNGVELIQDIGGSVVPEAMKLIGDSGVKAARRLRLYRLAYGRAGSESNLGVKEVRQVAGQYLTDTKITLAWAEKESFETSVERKGFLKLLLNLIILAEESLAYGGTVSVHDLAPGEDGCRIEIAGRNAAPNPVFQAAIENTLAVEDLSPRTIQSYLAARLSEQFGFKLDCNQTLSDRFDLLLTPAKAEPEVQCVNASSSP